MIKMIYFNELSNQDDFDDEEEDKWRLISDEEDDLVRCLAVITELMEKLIIKYASRYDVLRDAITARLRRLRQE